MIQKNTLTFKLKEGEVLCMNNRRLLHGRTGLQGETETKKRYIHGCYFDWDGLFTHMRPIKRRLDDAQV